MSIRSPQAAREVWARAQQRKAAREAMRLKRSQIRLWDGDYTLRGEVAGELGHGFEFVENDTGTAWIRLPLDHYLAKWAMDFKGRTKRNVHITFDKQGARWSGRMDNYKVVRNKDRSAYVELTFKHDYEELKHIYCWANPFLPAEFQFPKVWMLFGPAKWALSLTLFVNIMRLESSIWALPEDPGDPSQWFNFNMSTWRHAIKPFPFAGDHSNTMTVFSRFKTFHDVAKRALEDAQLTIECRRYLPGDPPPWEGANLRPGCLVWEIVDNSGWRQGTSFGGNLLTGLERAYISIANDGLTEGINVFTGDPTFPDEYYIPGWQGTRPSAPWVVFEEGIYTGIEESEFSYFEATDVRYMVGGHSAPGVNEGIKAAVNMAGDLIAMAIGIPPVGGAVDAILSPLYTDVIAAFMWWGDGNRAAELGAYHYYEGWAEGADRAYTLGAVMALRAKKWETRAHIAHTIKVADAAPYYVGPAGYGDFWLGSRVGTAPLGYPVPNTVFVERVKKLGYTWDENGPSGWQIEIGYQEPRDPLLKLYDEVRELMAGFHDAGLV